MKIIEGLKRMKVIEKKMHQNASRITLYSSMVSTEKPLFETEDKQRREVGKLIQSNQDLLTEYLKLKRRVEETNLAVTAEIGGTKYSLADLLIIERKMASQMMMTYNAMNDSEGGRRISQLRMSSSVDGKTPVVTRFYREEDKNAGLSKWQDLADNISSRLEVINATTDLME